MISSFDGLHHNKKQLNCYPMCGLARVGCLNVWTHQLELNRLSSGLNQD